MRDMPASGRPAAETAAPKLRDLSDYVLQLSFMARSVRQNNKKQ